MVGSVWLFQFNPRLTPRSKFSELIPRQILNMHSDILMRIDYKFLILVNNFKEMI